MSEYVLPVASLARREAVRFVRQRSRVLGSLAQALVIWVLFGAGFQASFRPGGSASGMGSAEYFFPGILALVILFTAVFSTISVVEDRHSGFLQGVLVAPVPRWTVVMGQAAGSTVLAVVQGLLLLFLAPLAGIRLSLAGCSVATGVMILSGFSVSCLSLYIAWMLDSTRGFHAIMNLILFPLWWLSGALFPAAGLPGWLVWLIRLNPVTYQVTALRRSIYLSRPEVVAGLSSMSFSLLVTVIFSAIMFAAAVRVSNRSTAR